MELKPPVRRAILLAAGRGTRLRPYTDSTPKPLLVYQGKPTLDYILLSLQAAGVTELVLVAHHLAEQIERYASLWSASQQLSVRIVRQSHLFGTAHALQQVIEQIPELLIEPFVLSATDYLLPREFFPDLLRFHASHDGHLSVSMKSLDSAELSRRSSIRFADDGSIAEIVEKPEEGTAPSTTGANLTFVLPPDITDYVQDVSTSARGEREIQDAINAWLRNGGRGYGLLQQTPKEWTPSN